MGPSQKGLKYVKSEKGDGRESWCGGNKTGADSVVAGVSTRGRRWDGGSPTDRVGFPGYLYTPDGKTGEQGKGGAVCADPRQSKSLTREGTGDGCFRTDVNR